MAGQTLAQISERKKPTMVKVPVVLDSEMADRHNDLRDEVAFLEARLGGITGDLGAELAEELDRKKSELEALRGEIQEGGLVAEFVFIGIPSEQYDLLINQNQPTDEQRRRARKDGDVASYNTETFPPALVAACLLSPQATADEVRSFWKDPVWNAAELFSLFQGALAANQTRRTIDLGNV